MLNSVLGAVYFYFRGNVSPELQGLYEEVRELWLIIRLPVEQQLLGLPDCGLYHICSHPQFKLNSLLSTSPVNKTFPLTNCNQNQLFLFHTNVLYNISEVLRNPGTEKCGDDDNFQS